MSPIYKKVTWHSFFPEIFNVPNILNSKKEKMTESLPSARLWPKTSLSRKWLARGGQPVLSHPGRDSFLFASTSHWLLLPDSLLWWTRTISTSGADFHCTFSAEVANGRSLTFTPSCVFIAQYVHIRRHYFHDNDSKSSDVLLYICFYRSSFKMVCGKKPKSVYFLALLVA
jgi:hypothetical protein